MAKKQSAKRKIWIVVAIIAAVDFIATFFGGMTIFGDSSKGKK
jgi:hypothetical protein